MSRDTVRNTFDDTRSFDVDFFADNITGEVEVYANFTVVETFGIISQNTLTSLDVVQNYLS